jgi:hypothetical protein
VGLTGVKDERPFVFSAMIGDGREQLGPNSSFFFS